MTNSKTGYRTIAIWAAILAVAAIAVAWAIPYIYGNAGVRSMVYIRPGMDIVALGDTLQIYHSDGFARRTARVLAWLDVDLSARYGAYEINPNDNPIAVAKKIRNHEQTPVKFTFNNLRLKEQFSQRASQQLMMHENDIETLLNDSATCAAYGKTPATITNILLPDTYEMYWNISPGKLLERLHNYYEQFWNSDRQAKAKALGLTPDEVQTLASIVEEESAKTDEYGKIARLYLNRIERGIPLQADPTIKFAIGDFSIRRITRAMLAVPSPYNTYTNTGLPPGPIRIASKRAIDAVLNAPQHNYLYMCAKEDFSGYHNFTASYSQHLANARRYQAELNRRNIK